MKHYKIVVVWWLSCVLLFATLWTAARQAFLSFSISRSLLKLMSIESIMLSNHLIFVAPFSSCPHLSQHQSRFQSLFFISGGPSIGPSPSASVLLLNIQSWFSLGWTGLISLLFRGLSLVFSSFRKTDTLFLMSFILFLSSWNKKDSNNCSSAL